ncbi:conserved hypothetical protein, partial [Ricinus communis]
GQVAAVLQLVGHHVVALGHFQAAEDVEALRVQVAEAEGDGAALGRAHALVVGAVRGAGLDTLVVLAQDVVDDAGHGVGAVLGRGAVLQDVDALDRFLGDGVDVDHRAATEVHVHGGDRRRAAAVDQDQGALRAEAAQRDGRDAADEAGGRAVADRTQVDGGIRTQQLFDVGITGVTDLFTRDTLDDGRRLLVRALDQRTGDLHALELLRIFGGSGLLRLGVTDGGDGGNSGPAQTVRAERGTTNHVGNHSCDKSLGRLG